MSRNENNSLLFAVAEFYYSNLNEFQSDRKRFWCYNILQAYIVSLAASSIVCVEMHYCKTQVMIFIHGHRFTPSLVLRARDARKIDEQV